MSRKHVDRTKYLDAGEVKRLREFTETWALADLAAGRRGGVVAWAVVDTALKTGLRVGELALLRCGDVDYRRSALRVVRLKRRKRVRETLAIDSGLRKHVWDFLTWKKALGEETVLAAPLFVGKRGPFTASGLQKVWKAAVRRAGLPSELSIHCARHTIATHLLRKTGNLRQVQKQLGHSSPTVTANMYADVSFADMKEGVEGLYG